MKIRGAMLLCAAATMLIASVLFAEEGVFPELKAEELEKLIDSRAKIVLIDARPELEYRQGHLPGAISIGPEKRDAIAGFLPKDKKASLIFYCRGVGCTLSRSAAVEAFSAGFRNIRIFQDGFPGWVAKGYMVVKPKQ